MIPLVLLSWAHVLGVGPVRLIALAAVVYLPIPSVIAVSVLLWRQRPHRVSRASMVCSAVAAELRAGSVLRDALRAATESSSIDLAHVDWHGDIGRIGDELAHAIPEIGEELRLTVAAAIRSGSSTAVLFDELSAYSLAIEDVTREVAMATAPARATAALLVGAPFLFVLSSVTRGDLESLLASPAQRTAGMAGLLLFVSGLTAASLVFWRGRR